MPEISEACTFCRIAGKNNEQRETFAHFFWHCNVTTAIITNLSNILSEQITPAKYWYGITDDSISLAHMIFFGVFRYVLWKSKLARTIPNTPSIIRKVVFLVEIATKLNSDLRLKMQNSLLLTRCKRALG